MLSILWMMIKILLLILASLLGLALLVLLLLLFVPIRYEIHMERQERFWMKGRISWLFALIRLPADYENGELTAKLKILCFTWKDFFTEEQEIKEKAKNILAEPEEENEKEEQEVTQEQPPGKETLSKAAQGIPAPMIQDTLHTSRLEKPGRNRPSFFGFLKSLCRIPRKIKNLGHSLHRCRRKLQRLKRFVTDERTKTALSLIWQEAVFFLQKIRPKKLEGYLHFGTEDPARTGEILGGLSLFYPIFQDDVRMEPDFSKKVLEGELHAKGHIRILTMIRMFWRLYRDPNVQFVYRMVT